MPIHYVYIICMDWCLCVFSDCVSYKYIYIYMYVCINVVCVCVCVCLDDHSTLIISHILIAYHVL